MFGTARNADVSSAIGYFRYYGGWADKVHGQTIEVRPNLAFLPSKQPILIEFRPMKTR